MTTARATVVPLRDHPEHCAFFGKAFETEWPSWYGPGGAGNAHADLRAFANERGALPVGVVALAPGHRPVGVAALKAASIAGQSHRSPWAAAGYVVPACRRQGIGALLLAALLVEAARLRFPAVYCVTGTAASLLRGQGWDFVESVVHDGHPLQVFRHASPHAPVPA